MAAEDALGSPGQPAISWQVDRELVLVLGGRRALLLQLAHPLVAQGVADHSSFPKDRFGRLFRTLDITFSMVFGDEETSERAIEQVRAVHRRVQGILPERVGRYPAGTPYRAEDPDLLMWVHATLVDTALLFYEMFVRPLSKRQRDQYYAGTTSAAVRFGIPPEVLPPDYGEFCRYWERTIDEELVLGRAGHEMANAVLYPSVRWLPRRLIDPLNLITIGTLPEPVRRMYRLRWNRRRAAVLRVLSASTPQLLRILPPRFRYVPHALEAERRIGEPQVRR